MGGSRSRAPSCSPPHRSAATHSRRRRRRTPPLAPGERMPSESRLRSPRCRAGPTGARRRGSHRPRRCDDCSRFGWTDEGTIPAVRRASAIEAAVKRASEGAQGVESFHDDALFCYRRRPWTTRVPSSTDAVKTQAKPSSPTVRGRCPFFRKRSVYLLQGARPFSQVEHGPHPLLALLPHPLPERLVLDE